MIHILDGTHYTVQLNFNLIITRVWEMHDSRRFQITRCVHACSLKVDDVWTLVKSIMSTRKCTRRVIFCRVYLLKHAHEWLSRETLEYCSANYRAICVCSTLNAYVIERRRLYTAVGAVHQTLSHRRLWIAVALSVPSNKAYGMLRDIELIQGAW